MSDGRHWLIYTHGGGRMGNQVLRAAHWLAWAMDYPDEIGLLNLAFWPYASEFAGTLRHPGCMYPGSNVFLDGLSRGRRHLPEWFHREVECRLLQVVHGSGLGIPGMQRIGRRLNDGSTIDLDSRSFFERVSMHHVTTCAGWKISGWERLRRHQSELRAFFQPAPAPAESARLFIEQQRRRFGRLIGVLIRQGDYMTWQNGRFGYDTWQYVDWIRQMLALEGGTGVGFVIASDTWQDPALFDGLPCVFSSGSANAGGTAIASFAELAGCDLIAGPPSTFAAMAAFVGACPLWALAGRGQCLDRNQILPDGLLDAAVDPVYSQVVK